MGAHNVQVTKARQEAKLRIREDDIELKYLRLGENEAAKLNMVSDLDMIKFSMAFAKIEEIRAEASTSSTEEEKKEAQRTGEGEASAEASAEEKGPLKERTGAKDLYYLLSVEGLYKFVKKSGKPEEKEVMEKYFGGPEIDSVEEGDQVEWASETRAPLGDKVAAWKEEKRASIKQEMALCGLYSKQACKRTEYYRQAAVMRAHNSHVSYIFGHTLTLLCVCQ